MKNNQRTKKLLGLSLLVVSLTLILFNQINSVYADPPSITHPEDMTINEGDIHAKISWTATSDYPNDYDIYEDGALAEVGSWSANFPIFYSISHLKVGDHEITVYIYDEFLQSNNDTVLVHVRDFSAPIIYSSPENMTVELDATDKYLEWSATDPYPASYELTRNGVIAYDGIWSGELLLRFAIDTSELGTYNYCLSVTDQSNNTAFDCVIVEVVKSLKTGYTSVIIPMIAVITLVLISKVFKRKFH